jgi:aminopeptidase N
LDFRAPVRVLVSVPNGFTAISVGGLRGVEKSLKTSRFHWETTHPASMVSLAVGRYVQQSVSAPMPAPRGGPTPPSLPVTCYTFTRHKDRAPKFLKEAAAMVRFYSRLFGPYPYEKLAVVEIPLFPGGYGTTSFVMLIDKSFEERKLDRELLAHEIAHQWWGNSVFPQGLGAAWLTEAFANYSAWMYDAESSGNPRVLQKRVAQAAAAYFAAAERQGDQPIAETDPYQPVGATQEILYEKGAVVLHMLRAEIGDAAFRRTLRSFADGHRFGKATIADFRKAAEGASNQDLGWFFEQWLGREGGMSLIYSFTTEPGGNGKNEVVLTVTQEGVPYRGRLPVAFQVENSVQREQVELTGATGVFRFPVRGKVLSVLFDPDGTFLMKPARWLVAEGAAAR